MRGGTTPQNSRSECDLDWPTHAAIARQAHHDERADAHSRADPHGAAVQLDQRFGDGETETRAVIALGELALDLLERASKLGERGRRNADAGIVDADEHAIARST